MARTMDDVEVIEVGQAILIREAREHVNNPDRCRYLMEQHGMRPGLDFSTTGCLQCFEVIGYCKCIKVKDAQNGKGD